MSLSTCSANSVSAMSSPACARTARTAQRSWRPQQAAPGNRQPTAAPPRHAEHVLWPRACAKHNRELIPAALQCAGPPCSLAGGLAGGRRGERAGTHQEGAQRQRQAGDLGEHAGAQHHQQRQRRKHVRVAHVSDAAVDGPQQRAPACDDHADAGHCLRARNSCASRVR